MLGAPHEAGPHLAGPFNAVLTAPWGSLTRSLLLAASPLPPDSPPTLERWPGRPHRNSPREWSVSAIGGSTAGASAARLGGGGPEFTASGVTREAFQPGDLEFPRSPPPPRAPRPLFSPSGNTPLGSRPPDREELSRVPPRKAPAAPTRAGPPPAGAGARRPGRGGCAAPSLPPPLVPVAAHRFPASHRPPGRSRAGGGGGQRGGRPPPGGDRGGGGGAGRRTAPSLPRSLTPHPPPRSRSPTSRGGGLPRPPGRSRRVRRGAVPSRGLDETEPAPPSIHPSTIHPRRGSR